MSTLMAADGEAFELLIHRIHEMAMSLLFLFLGSHVVVLVVDGGWEPPREPVWAP